MLVNTLLCMHGRTFALPIFSIGNPSGIFLSIALLDKTECHLVGAGLESQFPFNSLSPTTLSLGTRVFPEELEPMTVVPLPKNQLRLPCVISFGMRL